MLITNNLFNDSNVVDNVLPNVVIEVNATDAVCVVSVRRGG